MIDLGSSSVIVGTATLIGAFVGAMTQVALGIRKRQRKQMNLRSALLAEVRTYPDLSERELVKLSDLHSPKHALPTSVYENNSQKIGNLTESEISKVVGFYSRIIGFRDMMGDDPQDLTEEQVEYFSGLLEYTEDWRQSAIEELEKNS